MWVQKVVRSKFVKCFMIAIVLVFSYEVSKPKALVPLAWAGAVLAGMAAEQLVTMGVKSVSKAVLKKKADDFSAQALKEGKFDFMGTNPYRNKDGSISLSPTANDRAKMAGLISGALIGSMIGENACTPIASDKVMKFEVPPDKLGGTDLAKWQDAAKRANDAFYIYKDVNTLGNPVVKFENKLTGAIETKGPFDASYVPNLKAYVTSYSSDPYVHYMAVYYTTTTGATSTLYTYNSSNSAVGTTYKTDVTTATSLGETLNLCNGLIIPSTVHDVYPAPMDMSSTFKMPNDAELSNKPIVIYNVMPASTTEGPVTWAEIEDYYNQTGNDFAQVVNGNIDTYLANGDYTKNAYTIDTINNYYTDKNYSVKVPDFKPDLEVPVEEEPNLPGEPISDLDPSMWQVMKNTYNYLDDGIDASLASMKGITDSAQGITTYLNQTMGWLPMEFRAVLTSAFVLGVFAHFLRR